MSTNLLPRTRRYWRGRGYYVEGTESIMRFPGGVTRRSDLFGIADLVAVPEDGAEPWIFLQVTSHSNAAKHVRKLWEDTVGKGQWERPIKDLVRRVLEHGDRIIIEGWQQPNGPGTRWVCRPREITMEALENETLVPPESPRE